MSDACRSYEVLSQLPMDQLTTEELRLIKKAAAHGSVELGFDATTKVAEIEDDFERRYVKVKNPSCVFDKSTCTTLAHNHLRIYYQNNPDFHVPTKKGKPLNVWNKWLLESKSNVDGLDFRPDMNPFDAYEEATTGLRNRILNIFPGWGVTPDETADCSLFLDFIRDVVACGDEKIFHWVVSWMARIVQRPTDRVHVHALAFQGLQGTGKTFFFDTFGAILGKLYLKIEDIENLMTFNSQLSGKLLVYLEEALFVASQKESNRLKDLITAEQITINPKHVQQYTIKNYVTVGSGTNGLVSAPIEAGDRRWVCLKLSDAHREDHTYFAAIKEQLEWGGYGALLHYLQTYELDLDFLSKRPMTELHEENRRAWLARNRPVFAFLRELLERHNPDSVDILTEIDLEGWIPAARFNSAFSSWLEHHRDSAKSSDARVVIGQLEELLGHRVTGRRYFGVSQKRAYLLGSLEEIETAILGKDKDDVSPF